MFVDLSLSHTGRIVYMKLFDESPNKCDWGVFEAQFRKLLVDIKRFGMIIDTSEAIIYAPKWIKKFVGLMLELTPEMNDQVTRFKIVVVQNNTIRNIIKQLIKLNQSERTIEFVESAQDAVMILG